MKSILSTLTILIICLASPQLQAADESNAHPAQTSQDIHSPASSTIRPPDAPGPIFPPEDFMQLPENENNSHSDRFYTEFLNMLATLGLVIGIILIAAWFLKRLLNTRIEQINTTSTIKISERRALSPKTALYLLEIHGKTVLIAESQNGVTHLAQFTSESTTSSFSSESPPSSFNKILEGNLSDEKKKRENR